MEVKAKLNNFRMSPRKVRLAAGLMRGKTVAVAKEQLRFSAKWAAKPLLKLLASAVANAQNNFGLAEDNLYIKTITVDGGPTLKRWMPRAHGRATPLNKRTSHITVTLTEIKPTAQADKTDKVEKEADVKLETVKVNEIKETKTKKDKQDLNGPAKPHKTEGSAKRGFTGKVFQRKSV